jgi:quinol monooxygenase YgiN
MDTTVYWVIELAINAGQHDAFKALMEEMVASTRKNEPGTTIYEWTITEDRSSVAIFERYVDSAAALKHIATFGSTFATRFLACVKPTRFALYGSPSSEVVEALSAFSPICRRSWGGFTR